MADQSIPDVSTTPTSPPASDAALESLMPAADVDAGHAPAARAPAARAPAARAPLTSLLHVASEISGQVNAILDPDELLNTVIPLLKDGFDLYYVHVYVLDEDSGELRLRAGYGDAGRTMLERGHRIPLDAEKSLVARAARSREPVVANDVRRHADFLPNPLLPETKSELAIPMVVGDDVLGVFDIQDDVVEAFPVAQVDVLYALAGQIATALQNARYVERIKQNLDDLRLTQFTVDHAPAAILWIRPDGSIYSANETACECFGYARSEFLAMPFIDRLDPSMTSSAWAAHWQKVREDRRLVMETEYLTQKGRLVPVEVTANYLAYGDQEYNCVFARDITERKQAEAARDRFTVQLRTAAEISEQVGAILDPDALLATVIPLLKERFNLYHAHVYVLEGDSLVLRSGYGRIGRIMVEQGHAIPHNHEHSLVARAARTREVVVVDDVIAAPDFLPNMLLPKTKSEVAVPIVIGDQVLGVFDVQSDRRSAFSDADLDVFRTFSGQLANALYSAMLFDQQREMQRELLSSAQTVRAIFDAMTEGILVTDLLGRITDTNEAALRLFGYAARSDLLGRSSAELVTRSAWSRMAENSRHTLDTGRGRVAEYTMLRQDGSTFDGEQSTALLWDDGGEPHGMVAITRDVTERKRARREITRFQALAENAVDAILMTDFSGQVTYANPAACRLFGPRSESAEMVGKHLATFWPESEVETLLGEVLPVAGDAGWQGEVLQKRADGTEFEAAMTFFAVQGEQGGPSSAATIVRDITARKAAERDLLRFTVQLRTASEVSAQVTAMLDPTELLEAVVPLVQGRFELYHVHVYTLDPVARELVMQVGSGDAGRVMREQGHKIALRQEPSLVAKAARTRRAVLVDDVTIDSNHLPNPLLPETRSEIAIPLLVGDEVIGVLDVQDDAPAAFSTSDIDVLNTLATQVAIALRNAQYFRELQAVAERLREVDRLKSEFLANMSHELRTPLNSVLGYAEVMLMGIDGELTADMEEDLTAIFENGQQLLRLINDILDLTKIEAGRMTIHKEVLEVFPLLEQTKNHNMGLLHKQQKSVELLVFGEADLPPIEADPVRFAQVLNNLVSNAVKFTDKGTVEIRASYNDETDRLYIDVADTGVGIAAEDLDGLFERFHQVDGSSTRRAEGTGLGLAISKHLVEMHGGDLSVVSEVDVGSTFTIAMPVVARAGRQLGVGE